MRFLLSFSLVLSIVSVALCVVLFLENSNLRKDIAKADKSVSESLESIERLVSKQSERVKKLEEPPKKPAPPRRDPQPDNSVKVSYSRLLPIEKYRDLFVHLGVFGARIKLEIQGKCWVQASLDVWRNGTRESIAGSNMSGNAPRFHSLSIKKVELGGKTKLRVINGALSYFLDVPLNPDSESPILGVDILRLPKTPIVLKKGESVLVWGLLGPFKNPAAETSNGTVRAIGGLPHDALEKLTTSLGKKLKWAVALRLTAT